VTSFFEAFYQAHRDARELGAVRIAAVGPGTARKIEHYRFAVDLIPKTFVAEGLLEEFKKMSIENLRILLPRAGGAREHLATALEDMGALVDDIPVYHTVPETDDSTAGIKRFCEEGADLVTFTSASTAQHFLALIKQLEVRLSPECTLASIGPITSSEMKEQGMPVGLEAEQHDIPGLVEAIVQHFTSLEA